MIFIARNTSFRKSIALIALSFITFAASAQTDTLFWFSAPEINRYHVNGSDASPGTFGYPVFLRMTTGALASKVTISMPANKANFNGGNDILLNIPANTTQSLNLSPYLGDDKAGVNNLTSMENRLRWATSNVDIVPKTGQYINKNNKGIKISATATITAYYEISSEANMDLISLKGQNALGQEFFVPFQTTYDTRTSYNFNYKPYSSFDIVATDDNTEIEITPTQSVFVISNGGNGGSFLPANVSFKIWLNKGQTAIIAPYSKDLTVGHKYQTDYYNRLAGSRVVVKSGSDISIITRDDMVQGNSGNVDFVTDQLVPITHIGTDYAVVVGRLLNKYNEERIFVVSTQANTTLSINGTVSGPMLAMGETREIVVANGTKIVTIHADKPVYVYHLSGFGNDYSATDSQSQFAGALIPTISVCTGSSQVGFNRTKASEPGGKYYDFYLNILVRTSATSGFVLLDKNKDTVTVKVVGLGVAASFTPVPGYPDWSYASFAANGLNKDEAYMLKNTKDVFHLGILNGYAKYDAFYGYFSDFNLFKAKASEVSAGSDLSNLCYGSTVQLTASGGANISWSPVDFLDNPFVANPIASNVTHSQKYEITVTGACGLTDKTYVQLNVGQELIPKFTTDVFAGCSPLTVSFDNISSGGSEYRWDFNGNKNFDDKEDLNGDGDFDELGEQEGVINNKKFTRIFTNTTSDTLRYNITLLVDKSGSCSRTVIKSILVYPQVKADFVLKVKDPNGCHPLPAGYTNISTGNYGAATFSWNFGDGGSSASFEPTHTFNNFGSSQTTYKTKLVLADRWNFCKDSIVHDVKMQPYIKASFVIDTIEHCSPLKISVVNDSKGAVDQWYWDKDGNKSFETSGGGNWLGTYAHSNATMKYDSVMIGLYVTNKGGCTDTLKRKVKIYPQPKATIVMDNHGNANGCSPLTIDFTGSATNSTSTHWLIENSDIKNTLNASYKFENFGSIPINKTAWFVASNDFGCADTMPSTMIVQPYVKAQFVLDKKSGCSGNTGLSVKATNASSAGCSIYSWSLDGGAPIAGKDITVPAIVHSSATTAPDPVPGSRFYPIILTAKNAAGCTDIYSQTVEVYPQPTVSFTYTDGGNANHCSPFTGTFAAVVNNADNFLWTFGNQGGTGDLSPNPFEFSNTTGGDLDETVTLLVKNGSGCNATVSDIVKVRSQPVAYFTLDKQSACGQFDVTGNALVVTGTPTYKWYFDNIYSGAPDVSQKKFTVPANLTGGFVSHAIYVEVSNGFCSAKSDSRFVAPLASISAEIISSDQANNALLLEKSCSPLKVHLEGVVKYMNGSVAPATTLWDLADNTNSKDLIPGNHDYMNGGVDNSIPYNVKLGATTKDGCKVDVSKSLEVYPGATSAFNVSVIEKCTPMKLRVTDASLTQAKPGTTYSWLIDGGVGTPGVNGEVFDLVYNNPAPSEVALPKTITLNLKNSFGCVSKQAAYSFSVDPEVKAVVVATIDKVCAPNTLSFDNKSTGGPLNFLWEFGDGKTLNVSDRSSQPNWYENTGASTLNPMVKLTATNPKGCSNSATVPVWVNPAVRASFSADIEKACDSFTSKFINLTPSAAYKYSWLVDGVEKGTAQDFSYLFDNKSSLPPATKPYTVVLNVEAIDNATCKATTNKTITVYPRIYPSFAFVDKDKDCNPLTAGFINTTVAEGAGTTYLWDLDNGASTTEASPTGIKYVNEGYDNLLTFNPKLTATSKDGCTASTTLPVVVWPAVTAAFNVSVLEKCYPMKIKVTDASLAKAKPGTTYTWNVDGGVGVTGFNGESFELVYNNPAPSEVALPKTITLDLKNSFGCVSKQAAYSFSVDPEVKAVVVAPIDKVCAPNTLSFNNNSTGGPLNFLWNFGDGKTLNISDRSSQPHLYENNGAPTLLRTVTITATNAKGCANSASTTVSVNPAVLASFSVDIEKACDPFTSKFINLTPSTAYSYSWTVDGAPMGVAQDFNHLFGNLSNLPQTQKHQVVLNVEAKDNAACKASITKEIMVYPRVYPEFSMLDNGCHPFTTTFANNTLAEGAGTTYLWTLGNGTSSTLASPKDINYINDKYVDDVVYPVKLKAVSKDGCVDEVSHPVTVHAVPKVEFTLGGPNAGCAPWPVTFNNTSIGNTMKYDWDFGNGHVDVDYTRKNYLNESYDNNTPDVEQFQVKLIGTSQYGCTANLSQTVFAYPHVKANYSFNPGDKACNPFTVDMVNQSQNTNFYTWTFDDGQGSALSGPQHLFENKTVTDQVFNVKLRSESTYGCWDEITKPLTVYAAPVADFQPVPPLQIYPNATFALENKTFPADPNWTYRWSLGDGQVRTGSDFNSYTYTKWGPKSDDFRYKVTLETANAHCSSAVSKYLTLLPAKPVSFYTSNISKACSPLEVDFYNNSTYGDNVLWDFGDGNTSTEKDPHHKFTEPGYYNVKLSVFGDGGVDYSYGTFQVFKSPVANFEINPTTLLLPEANAHFYNTSRNASRYAWDFGDATLSSIEKDAVHRYSNLGLYNVKLTVWTSSEEGDCVDDTTVLAAIKVIGQGKLAFPNAFIPSLLGRNNGAYDEVDYQNQVFHPVWEGVEGYTLRIFNRWGEQVFESKDVKVGWDGYFNGQLCSPDVYVWKAEGRYTNGKTFSKMGDVTLIR